MLLEYSHSDRFQNRSVNFFRKGFSYKGMEIAHIITETHSSIDRGNGSDTLVLRIELCDEGTTELIEDGDISLDVGYALGSEW